eukprot:3196575-Pleurochrysis_carterae.AAC.1
MAHQHRARNEENRVFSTKSVPKQPRRDVAKSNHAHARAHMRVRVRQSPCWHAQALNARPCMLGLA